MPEQEGLEVIRKVQQRQNPVPIIAITGHPAKTALYLKIAITLDAQRVLANPFGMEDLLADIRELLVKPGSE